MSLVSQPDFPKLALMKNVEAVEAVAAKYLQAGTYIDSDHPAVIAYAQKHAGSGSPRDQAVNLYYAIRDGFRYDPYNIDLRPEAMRASALLDRTSGYCGEKAALLAASCRVLGIPARVHFTNVRNHIGTEKLEEYLGTDVLVFHGYTELFLDGKWVKATPAFNKSLCEKLNVAPLEFDGTEDSIFQEYDREGGRFMDYLHDYGHFADLPREQFIAALKKYYPRFFDGSLPEELGMKVHI